MNVRERTFIYAEGDFETFEKLADMVLDRSGIKIVREPRTCLVMMKTLDSVEQAPFYLGEVLITEAAVELDGITGFGFALENQPVKALCFAVMEAALEANHETAPLIREALEVQAAALEKRRRRERSMLAGTRVNFDVMEG